MPENLAIGNVISIFSTKGGVGKTLFSVNLAIALAQEGRKVALIDLDLQAIQDMARMIDATPQYSIFDIVTILDKVEHADAIKTKYPEQVVIAIAKDRNGKANPVTLGWTMIASGDPPMMAIAVAKTHYSVEAITHSECFTVAFPSSAMGEAALFFQILG